MQENFGLIFRSLFMWVAIYAGNAPRPELREWAFHSESVFPEIGVDPRVVINPFLEDLSGRILSRPVRKAMSQLISDSIS